jgi:ribosome-binding factor A
MAARSKAKPPKTGPTQRQLRVGEQLRHVLIETLKRGKFNDIALIDAAQMVTVTEVKTAPDLKNATAFILLTGGPDVEIILTALTESASIFQREFAKKLQMKFTPKIHFKYDDTFEKARRIDEILYNLPKPTSATTISDDEDED